MEALTVRWQVRPVAYSHSRTEPLYYYYATAMFQHELSEMEELTSTRLSLAVDCSISSSPSIYRGGTVDLDAGNMGSPVSRFAVLTSIVCEADYWHLSPEVRYYT